MAIRISGQTRTPSEAELRQNTFSPTCLLTRDVSNAEFDLDELPTNITVPGSGELLIPQIAISGGLHTCDMTSTVNGYIWQGWITSEQGEEVHKKFPEEYATRDPFRPTINGQIVEIAGQEEHFVAKIAAAKLYSDMIRQTSRTEQQVKAVVCGALANDLVLNVGDGGHARLAVGYRRDGTDIELNVRDPYTPNEERFMAIGRALVFRPGNAILAIAQKQASLAYKPEVPFA